ncbi:MAG: SpoIID/LytB domain-containing protein [Pseudomonadota bacterium]
MSTHHPATPGLSRVCIGVAATWMLVHPLIACGPTADVELEALYEVPLPLSAFCSAQVEGHGLVDVESDYLPHVVTCENGGAPFESLKAQAVAARTYLYYKLSLYGSIRDGTSDQVYSCSAQPGDAQIRAVRETAGQFLSYRGGVICSFFVAGARQSAPSCQGGTSDSTNTERYVTYNWNLSGSGIHQSTLGWVNSGNNANRGCLSQWGSRCLADAGWNYLDILHFYYGMDAGLETASGSCVAPPAPVNQPPIGHLDAASCDEIRGWAQDPDAPGEAIAVHLYVDGPAGDAAAIGLSLAADRNRADLCAAIGSCDHGFVRSTPRSLRDGRDHPVYAYAIDSAGGVNALLGNAPATLRCDPPAPPLSAAQGRIRWVVNPASLEAWHFSTFEDLAHVDDALLSSYREGPALPSQPRLVRGDDDTPEVWLLDTGVRRHVTSSASFEVWRFSWDAVESVPAEEIAAMPRGAPWPAAPFLMQGSGPAVYVLDDENGMGSAPEADAGAPDSGEQGDASEVDASPANDVDAGFGEDASAHPSEPSEAAGEGEGLPPANTTSSVDALELGQGLSCSATSHRGASWVLALVGLALARLARKRIRV